VTAELGVRAVRAHHHRERVPANDRGEPVLGLQVAGKRRLVGEPDRVAVRRVENRRHAHALRARPVEQPAQQERRALGAFVLDERVERVEPLARLGRVDVRRGHAPVAGERGMGEIGHGDTLGSIARWYAASSSMGFRSSCSLWPLTAYCAADLHPDS
jgi:hypothetical protein